MFVNIFCCLVQAFFFFFKSEVQLGRQTIAIVTARYVAAAAAMTSFHL